MEKNLSVDRYLYDFNKQPLAELKTISTIRFDSKSFKENHPRLYKDHEIKSSFDRWFLI